MTDLFGHAMDDADMAALIAQPDGTLHPKWAPMLTDMVRVLESDNKRRGKAPPVAFADACSAVVAISDYFGGTSTYLPRGEQLKTALRHAEIWRAFNGKNARALAKRYDLSYPHVCAVLKEQRALHTRKLQGRLFDD